MEDAEGAPKADEGEDKPCPTPPGTQPKDPKDECEERGSEPGGEEKREQIAEPDTTMPENSSEVTKKLKGDASDDAKAEVKTDMDAGGKSPAGGNEAGEKEEAEAENKEHESEKAASDGEKKEEEAVKGKVAIKQ